MDQSTGYLLGFIGSVVAGAVIQFIIAARSSRDKLEEANKSTLMSKLETLDVKLSNKLDQLSSGQETMKAKIEGVEKQLEEAKRELEEAKRQLKERHEEAQKKAKNIRVMIKKIHALELLYKRMEHWKADQNLKEAKAPNEAF